MQLQDGLTSYKIHCKAQARNAGKDQQLTIQPAGRLKFRIPATHVDSIYRTGGPDVWEAIANYYY